MQAPPSFVYISRTSPMVLYLKVFLKPSQYAFECSIVLKKSTSWTECDVGVPLEEKLWSELCWDPRDWFTLYRVFSHTCLTSNHGTKLYQYTSTSNSYTRKR